MGGGKNSPPPAPDYTGAAVAQGQANKDAAISTAMLSNPNIYGPYGSQTVSYSQGPDGNWIPTVRQSLSPAEQGLLNANNTVQLGLANLGTQALGTVQNVMGQPFNGNNYPLQTSFDNPNLVTNANQNGQLDLSGVAKMPINAGMTAQSAIMSRLQPQLDRQTTSTQTQLANQGLRPGMEAYDNAMHDLAYQQNDQLTQAALQGLNLDMSANQQGYNQALNNANFANQANLTNANFANSAAAQQFQQNQAEAQFGNTAQQQAYQQALNNYNLPLNQVAALMSGSQVTNPQFQGYTGATVSAAPVFQGAQAQGNYNQGIFNAQTSGQNAFMGGLMGLGAAAAGMPTTGGGSLGGNFLSKLIS